ncbi:MAG TPA: hypothetical protein PLS53_05215 [Thermoanaerobaculaceae bacterium]|nr:hypothetical protein [Thermoanaerobaculaceae bacterium]HPS77537.1 hypothetical protein [Thermoanaerobaculaceae bacterium]
MSSAALGFASLFLGLVTGRQQVELLVTPPVTTVEVQVDGRAVGMLNEAPWRLEVDFGTALCPHHLDAVGRDAGGHEVARVRQRINLPRPAAEVEVSLSRDPDGRVSGATLSWQKNDWKAPRKILADLDGESLPVLAAGRLSWLPSDPRSVHLLRVVLDFDDGVTANREVVFGLDVAAEAESALTGVAVQYRRAGDAPALADLRGKVRDHEAQVRVVAVEKGNVQLAVVLDPNARNPLISVLQRALANGGYFDRLLDGRDTLLAVGTEPLLQGLPGGLTNAVFPVLGLPDCRSDELLRSFWLWKGFRNQPAGSGIYLSGAVALAGLRAMATNQRRAVLLIAGEGALQVEPGSVRRTREFLASIGVPLEVWTPVPKGQWPEMSPWGELVDVSTSGGLFAADIALKKLLRRQRIVWLDGDHLPQDIELAPGLDDLRIAGR